MTEPTTHALAVEHLSHSYGARKALDDVSFVLRRGAFAALLGLNGAGKSTLFSLVTRLFVARTGEISVLGHDVNREPGEALRRLGVVFQQRTLDLDLSVMQNMVYHAALHGIGAREAQRCGAAALEKVAMADRAGDKARDLSGGQMRRVEIARALVHEPTLVILDEPTVGLDVNARADIIAHVRKLVRDDGLSVLWTTHLIDEIAPTDDVLVLHRGKLLAQGNAQQIMAQTGTGDVGAAFVALTGAVAQGDAR
ncbi:MAG: ATP-binding cassette domain-containing protein [Hyphomicrobiales bacterium]|nr:ATP-binding cassette domain-containing protein [Hyphomicrobiales bacterium]